MVQINLYSLHRKKEIWIDPENFRPERFLNHNGAVVQVVRTSYIYPGKLFVFNFRTSGSNLSLMEKENVLGSS